MRYEPEMWSDDPPDVLLWADFQLLAQVNFTTTTNCFPCPHFGSTLHCFHVDGVRQTEGLPSNRDPKDRLFGRRNARGRKPAKKAGLFVHQVAHAYATGLRKPIRHVSVAD